MFKAAGVNYRLFNVFVQSPQQIVSLSDECKKFWSNVQYSLSSASWRSGDERHQTVLSVSVYERINDVNNRASPHAQHQNGLGAEVVTDIRDGRITSNEAVYDNHAQTNQNR